MEKESYLLELSRYVVLNPIRARMIKDMNQWKWSSYQATSGKAQVPDWLETDWLLSQFGRQRKRARERYIDFVRDHPLIAPLCFPQIEAGATISGVAKMVSYYSLPMNLKTLIHQPGLLMAPR